MMSRTAIPATMTQHQVAENMEVKDAAYVSIYNSDDYTDYLYKTPAFATGFIALEAPVATKPIPVPARVRPAETSNTGTTPPPKTFSPAANSPCTTTTLKSAIKHTSDASRTQEVRERRPSFVRLDLPAESLEEHEQQTLRKKLWNAAVPMSWWPESESTAEHVWVEKSGTEADEEGDVLEGEVWNEVFYE